MFEAHSPSEMPPSSIWASMNSWFTPAVFFVLLNVMIGTIAFTSTLANKKQNQTPSQIEETHDQQPKTPILQRLKSTNFYPYFQRSKDPQNLYTYKQNLDSFDSEQSRENLDLQSHYFFQENLQLSQSQTADYMFEQNHEQNHQEPQSHLAFEQEDSDLGGSMGTHFDFEQKELDLGGSNQAHTDLEQKDSKLDCFEGAQEKIEENEAVEQSMDEVYSEVTGSHSIMTKPEPTTGEIAANLFPRMKKSASLKSLSGHSEEEKIVEARRPATVRERRGNSAGAAEGDDEVDARADDFINKFKQQLKLQRLHSIIRYKDTIGRSTAGT